MSSSEKRAELKAELSQLSEVELKERWNRREVMLREHEQEAQHRGYSTPNDERVEFELRQECELIDEILKERILSDEDPLWGLFSD